MKVNSLPYPLQQTMLCVAGKTFSLDGFSLVVHSCLLQLISVLCGYDLTLQCQFPAMIDDWRTKFQLPDMYFGFVQLAPWIAVSLESRGKTASILSFEISCQCSNLSPINCQLV